MPVFSTNVVSAVLRVVFGGNGNLMVLLDFIIWPLKGSFKSEDLGSLAGASVVEHQLQLHLPKFSTFSHEYQDFVAHDKQPCLGQMH